MIQVDYPLFIFICVLASIGALVVIVIVIYVIAGILDLTYFDRHKKRSVDDNASKCPYEIE